MPWTWARNSPIKLSVGTAGVGAGQVQLDAIAGAQDRRLTGIGFELRDPRQVASARARADAIWRGACSCSRYPGEAILSTCNRVELYLARATPAVPTES